MVAQVSGRAYFPKSVGEKGAKKPGTVRLKESSRVREGQETCGRGWVGGT